MKRVTIRSTDGEVFTEDALNGAELPQALQEQQPAFALRLHDESVLYLNCRQVIGVSIEDVPEDEVTSDEPEADPRTVAELKEDLDAAGIEYPATAKKADLLELASTNGI